MKILQLVNRVPFPLTDGGNIGVHYYTEGFVEAGVTLSMLAMNTSRHFVDLATLPGLYSRLHRFEVVEVDNEIRPLSALFNLIKGGSYNIDRFRSRSFERRLITMLQEMPYDIVQLEGLYLVPYLPTIRKYSRAKVVIRQHNIEYVIWERLSASAPHALKKWYLRVLAGRLKRFELAHLNAYDLVLPISERDAALLQDLGLKKPFYVHPFGIDLEEIPFLPAPGPPLSLYHIGAMDWLPNQESVDWLLERVMPVLAEKLPDVKLYLAGRNMPERYLSADYDNVIVVGEVESAIDFERDKGILVVPLLSGGGVRIKIFQAMAMGKAIVTTAIGLEGIEAEDGKEVYIANTPEAFVEKISQMARRPESVAEIGAAARELVFRKYNRKKLIASLLETYKALVAESGTFTR